MEEKKSRRRLHLRWIEWLHVTYFCANLLLMQVFMTWCQLWKRLYWTSQFWSGKRCHNHAQRLDVCSIAEFSPTTYQSQSLCLPLPSVLILLNLVISLWRGTGSSGKAFSQSPSLLPRSYLSAFVWKHGKGIPISVGYNWQWSHLFCYFWYFIHDLVEVHVTIIHRNLIDIDWAFT